MRYEFIDISFGIQVSNDKSLLDLLKNLNVVGVAQEGVERYFKLNSLGVYPRVSFKSGSRLSAIKGNKLVILKVNSNEGIRVTNVAKRSAIAVEVSGKALSKLSRKALSKLEALALPVVVKAGEIYSLLLKGEPLSGLDALLNEYVKGNLSVAVASGVKKVNELRHPITYVGLMIELGVPEALALEAVFNQPKIVVRRAGYSV